MAIDYDKWNQEFGGEEAVKALSEAKNNNQEYAEVPDGSYICKLEKLELGESKTGKPMVKGMFRIVEGENKKQCLFLNQVFTRGFPQHKALEFLRSLKIFEDTEIDFDGDFKDFEDLLLDIAEESEGMKFEIEKSKDGDFTRLEVTDVIG
jgi:hypothetical protein